jgi:hypothetical protein
MRPKTPNPATGQSEDAELMALRALTFLAADEDRLQRFLDLTGLDPNELRQNASNQLFLGAILDHLLSDESLLLVFSAEQGITPDSVGLSRRRLPGANLDL